MSYYRALTLLCALLLLSLAPSWSADLPQMKTWPDNFALASDDSTSYMIPVTSAGPISATITWKGLPLTLTLVDGKDQVVTTLAAQPAPTATLTYTVTQADLARGALWRLTITPAGPKIAATPPKPTTNAKTVPPPPPPAITGSITASYPPVNEAVLTTAVRNMVQQQATNRRNFVDQQQRQVKVDAPQLPDVSPARARELAAQEKVVRDRFQSVIAPRPTGPGRDVKRPSGPNIRPGQLEPAIDAIVPNNGCVDDVVTITCLCLTDATKAEVRFQFGNSTLIALAADAPVVLDTGETLLRVKVPRPVTNYTATTNIPVTVVDKGVTPAKTTPAANFAFDPYPAPTVTSIAPASLTVGRTVTIHGTRFQNGDKVYFTFPGLGDLPATTSVVSATTLTAVVPAYSATAPLAGSLYVKNAGNRSSGAFPFVAVANQSAVTSVYPLQAAPRETFMLSGSLLGTVNEVIISVRPRAQQGTTTAYITDALYTGTLKMEIVQKNDSALMLRVPFMEGFSGPLQVDLKLTGSGAQVSVPFTIKPEYVTVNYRVPCTTNTFQKKEGDDEYWTSPACRLPYWVVVEHNNNFWGGHRTDETFMSFPWLLALKYNWSFVDATLPEIWAIRGGARMTGSGVLADGNIFASVHSFVDTSPYGASVFYFLRVRVRGPRGVPMVITNNGMPGMIPDSTMFSY